MAQPGEAGSEVVALRAPAPDGTQDGEDLRRENGELRRLNLERERAVEATAQKLRQPLIDQLSWCELLMTDSERSLSREHVELVARINSTANDLLARVQELLDEEKIRTRIQAAERDGEQAGARTSSPSAGRIPVPGPSAAGEQAPPRSDAKVLVVEDSATLRDLLVSVLRPRFRVFSAADGWEALKRMVDRPDVIVTELDLPSVGVADLLTRARRVTEGVAVLALGDARNAALLASAQSLGIAEVLTKPFPIPALIEKVEGLAAARRAPPSKSILVVSRDPRQAEVLHSLLDPRYRTQIAHSAEAAHAARANPCDLLLVDTTAGDTWWQDVVAPVRKSHPEVQVLALVDSRDTGAPGALGQIGVAAAVVKPYACDDLLRRVRALLGSEEIDQDILRSVFRRAAI